MRTEGAYTYLCVKCGTFFAVVARFSIAGDYSETLKCPKCGSNAAIYGEGYIAHESNESNKVTPITGTVEVKEDTYPDLLTADHIAEIIGVSKRVAYEIMEHRGFPLIRIGRLKKVRKENLYEWLNNFSEGK